ncbi:MAG: hypothetical protein ABIJ15_08315 [bacterium]
MDEAEIRKKTVGLVNRYFTPLAIILVLSAIIFSESYGRGFYAALILMGIAVLNNVITVFIVAKKEWLRTLRVVVNLLVNIGLVYLLITYWYPIWFLLLLTPVATGVYSSRAHTWVTSVLVAALLMAIYAAKGLFGLYYWGQAFNHALLIIFLSLFVNSITQLNKTPENKK